MVYLSDLFTKYAEWQVLRYMLEHNPPIYVKELARKAGVSAGTASKALAFLQRCGAARVEKLANAKLYSLVDSPLIRQLRITAGLSRIDQMGITNMFLEEDPSLATLALYGSFADGTFDDKSDLDLIIVSESKKDFSKVLNIVEKELNREVTLLQYTLSDLQKLPKSDPVFFNNLRKKHIILYGAKLP